MYNVYDINLGGGHGGGLIEVQGVGLVDEHPHLQNRQT